MHLSGMTSKEKERFVSRIAEGLHFEVGLTNAWAAEAERWPVTSNPRLGAQKFHRHSQREQGNKIFALKIVSLHRKR